MIAVVVATAGRPGIVARLLDELAGQTRPPDCVVLSISDPADAPASVALAGAPGVFQSVIIQGDKGSTVQRNRAIAWLHAQTDIMQRPDSAVVFLDDDFLMRADWLAALELELAAQPEAVGFTGLVIADGAATAGYSFDEAVDILRAGTPVLPPDDWRLQSGSPDSLYGCNMAVRATALAGVRFDEALPLYAWLEDLEFSVRLGRTGGLRRCASLAGVHLGTKSGRSSGVRLGYSQIANPLYLHRQGIMPRGKALKHAVKNLLANAAHSFAPPPYIDRRGRLRGNLIALGDILRRRVAPDRILAL